MASKPIPDPLARGIRTLAPETSKCRSMSLNGRRTRFSTYLRWYEHTRLVIPCAVVTLGGRAVSICVLRFQHNWSLSVCHSWGVVISILILCSSWNPLLSSLGGGLGAGLRSNTGSGAADAAQDPIAKIAGDVRNHLAIRWSVAVSLCRGVLRRSGPVEFPDRPCR